MYHVATEPRPATVWNPGFFPVTFRPQPRAFDSRKALTLFAASISALVFAMCVAQPLSAQEAASVRTMRIATGPIDSTDFPFGGLVGNAISNPPGSRECDRGGNCGVPGLIAVAQTTAGAFDNLAAVAKGQVELGLTQADIVEWAFRAVGEFADDPPQTRVRVIARLYPATIHLIARRDAKISSITDLIGKRLAIDAEASGTRYTAKLILSAHKVRWTRLRLQTLDLAAAVKALQAGEIDAMFAVGGAPVLALEDLLRSADVELIPIDGPTAAKIAQVVPYYVSDTIPAGTYGNSADIATLAVGSVLIARDDLDEELGYGIAKAIWHQRNIELFATGHPRGKLMDPARAVAGVTVPIHAGAARYYVEQKVMAQAPAIAPAEPSKPLPPRPAARPVRQPPPSSPPPAPVPAQALQDPAPQDQAPATQMAPPPATEPNSAPPTDTAPAITAPAAGPNTP